MPAEDFLKGYMEGISGLSQGGNSAAFYLASMKAEDEALFTTMLPAAAAIKRYKAGFNFQELLAETKNYCLKEINKVLKLI